MTALRCGEAIRQEPCEERIGNTVEHGDAAGARPNATRRAGFFWVVGSSQGLPVFPIRAAPCSCPRHKIPPAQQFNLALTCSCSSGLPEPEAVWFRTGRGIAIARLIQA